MKGKGNKRNRTGRDELKYILHLIPSFYPVTGGGAENFALNLCMKIKKYGINQIIITRRYKGLLKKDVVRGVEVRRFSNFLPNKIKLFGSGINLRSKYLRMIVAMGDIISQILLLLKLNKKYKIKLIHSSFIVPTGLVGAICKKLINVPMVITVHGPADFYTVPKLIRKSLLTIVKSADLVITVSNRLELDIKKELKVEKVKTILNGIRYFDVAEYKNNMFFKKYNIDKNTDSPLLIMMGRLVKIKRVDKLIKAVPLLKDKFPNVKVVILGQGIERKRLSMLAKELDVIENIIMPGWISESDKIQLLGMADIYIHLSKEEGLSLSLLESQLAGLPVVVVGSKYIKEIIIDGKNGVYLKEPLQVKNIVKCIVSLFLDKERMSMYSRNALKNANKFTLDKMVEMYYKEYTQLFY
ncbi:MAG: glycosyltransferase family 4 protein [Candidatus Helarchaeota archaeon]